VRCLRLGRRQTCRMFSRKPCCARGNKLECAGSDFVQVNSIYLSWAKRRNIAKVKLGYSPRLLCLSPVCCTVPDICNLKLDSRNCLFLFLFPFFLICVFLFLPFFVYFFFTVSFLPFTFIFMFILFLCFLGSFLIPFAYYVSLFRLLHFLSLFPFYCILNASLSSISV
jgi:hypothetical protein